MSKGSPRHPPFRKGGKECVGTLIYFQSRTGGKSVAFSYHGGENCRPFISQCVWGHGVLVYSNGKRAPEKGTGIITTDVPRKELEKVSVIAVTEGGEKKEWGSQSPFTPLREKERGGRGESVPSWQKLGGGREKGGKGKTGGNAAVFCSPTIEEKRG